MKLLTSTKLVYEKSTHPEVAGKNKKIILCYFFGFENGIALSQS